MLISITVLGSAVIETTFKSYAHEGQLLVLSSDLDEVDENLERVYYDWSMADEQMNALIVPSDYLITSCVPSTLINERYMFQFAFVNQAFTGHFEGLMSNRDAVDIYLYMRQREWIVPVIDDQFHVALLDQFVKSLRLAALDLVFVSVVEPGLRGGCFW
ncbi:hypothetical protein RHGRI_031434 [Rhododendron griersonianum]|uniref:Uncharacterized protein n=1 Tax=Rhododendron griersonianum TaxID=479676 RepID=A0AAV6IDN2_9ERIC|nr:hypothetical protein RHGRI_031434 [Rhododendron griersonianum]